METLGAVTHIDEESTNGINSTTEDFSTLPLNLSKEFPEKFHKNPGSRI